MKIPLKIIIALIILSLLLLVVLDHYSPYPKLNTSDFVSPSQGYVKIVSKLYFVYDEALHSEVRRIKVHDGAYENAILDALILGPSNSQYKTLFNEGIQLISVENINNTCYVNLSGDFERILQGDRKQMSLYLWSIVNSLTELGHIYRVQFMLDGLQINSTVLGYSLNSPLPRNEGLFYQKERTASDTVFDFIGYLNAGRFDLAYGLLSNASYDEMDYSDFIGYASNHIEKTTDFKAFTSFTKVYDTYYQVFIKYQRSYDSDGFRVYTLHNWKVIKEDNIFKIQF